MSACRIPRRSRAWTSIASCAATRNAAEPCSIGFGRSREALYDQDILIAGCGTSQAARYALGEPTARVTAIDISETSLRHTRRLQRKYQLANLTLHQLPIERVG